MNRIRELRLSEGLSQKALAEELGVKQNTLSTWETGRYEPDSDMLKRIATRFSTSTDYVLGSDDKKRPTTVSSDGQAQKLAKILRDVGVDVDNLSVEQMRRLGKIIKAALEE